MILSRRQTVLGGLATVGLAAALRGRADAETAAIATQMVDIQVPDGFIPTYLATPTGGKGPGVMLVSTVFGVDDDMKGMCDDLARRGCVASVPNFFFRDQDPGPLAFPTGGQRAFQRVERLDFAKSMEDLKLVLAQLRSHEGSNGKLVVLGFCFGGPHAWRSVCDGLGVGGAMSFHGTYVSKYMRPGDKPVSPIALHYGDKDELAPPQELAAVKKVADATGAELVVYPGVGHGYMLHSHMGHAQPNAEAAKKSWDRALHMIDTLRI